MTQATQMATVAESSGGDVPVPSPNAVKRYNLAIMPSAKAKSSLLPPSGVKRPLDVEHSSADFTSSVVNPSDDFLLFPASGLDLARMTSKQLADSEEVFVHDLAELGFIARVLSMAFDSDVPLLERFKFLCIVSQNLDELFCNRPQKGALDPAMKFNDAVTAIVDRQHQCLLHEVLPELRTRGIEIVKFENLSACQQQALDLYFDEHLRPHMASPVLANLTEAPPLLQSHELYLLIVLEKPSDGTEHRAFLRVPVQRRLIPIDSSKHCFVTAENLCLANFSKLFPGMNLREAHPFRVTRNLRPEIDDTLCDGTSYVRLVLKECRRRRSAPATRLEVLDETPADVVNLLGSFLHLEEFEIFRLRGSLLDLKSCMPMAFVPVPALRETSHRPAVPVPFEGLFESLQTQPGAIFDIISERDVLVEYPEHSFKHSAVLFLEAAARDPQVRSIKTALYRAGSKSPVVDALLLAAKNGKKVTVFVELKASFEELRNQSYAQELYRGGCNVVCGIVSLKVHSKATLIVREKADGKFASFCNVSTGNYNADTAEVYTDVSLYTKREDVACDLHSVFSSLTDFPERINETYPVSPAHTAPTFVELARIDALKACDIKKLLVGPVSMLPTFVDLIRTEARNAREGKPARIACQMNGLTDKKITEELYDASEAGVQIDLIVRGVCRLRPGIPGKSENIRISSWVGPRLQHQRIFFFQNGGERRFFIGSADWRTRNLNGRVEVAVPVEDPAICKRLSKAFELAKDEKNVWKMGVNGRYYKTCSKPICHPVLAENSHRSRRRRVAVNCAKKAFTTEVKSRDKDMA